MDIKLIVDALVVVDTPIFVEDHIETILDGLLVDFDSFVASIFPRTGPYKVGEIKAILLVQEELLKRHHQLDPFSFPAIVPFTS